MKDRRRTSTFGGENHVEVRTSYFQEAPSSRLQALTYRCEHDYDRWHMCHVDDYADAARKLADDDG